MKTIRGFDAKANYNGLIQGSKERKKYLENEIELAKLYESKQQFEEQASDIAEFKNLEQWDKRAEILGISANSNPTVEALRSTVNKINKLEKANDEILAEAEKAMAERGEELITQAEIDAQKFKDGKLIVKESTEQFEMDDGRNIPEFCAMLRAKGLEPVFKNWDATFRNLKPETGNLKR